MKPNNNEVINEIHNNKYIKAIEKENLSDEIYSCVKPIQKKSLKNSMEMEKMDLNHDHDIKKNHSKEKIKNDHISFVELENKKKSDNLITKKIKLKIIAFALYLKKNYLFFIFINIFTFYALFGDYLRVLIFRIQADIAFDVIVIICIIIFMVEMIVFLIAEKSYLLSFYFFLDIITTIFLIFDITFISDLVFYNNNEINTASIITLEISKIVRIIRLIRILKFFKNVDFEKTTKKNQKISNKKNQNTTKESKITKILKSLNIKRMIVLILIMLVLIPFFNTEIWSISDEFKLKHKIGFSIQNFVLKDSFLEKNLDQLKKKFNDNDLELIKFQVDDIINYEKTEELHKLRKSEMFNLKTSFVYSDTKYFVNLIYSQRYLIKIQALLDLLNMIVICVLLVYSIESLNKKFSLLILNPLERMIDKIKRVSEDPLISLKNNYIELKGDEMNETLIIEKAINKISELLVLGFGQAGCRIITHFLFDPDKDFDQIIPGEKCYGIFGFCDIRNFTDTTEILLEDVLMFVNKIADIVHSSVEYYGGAANKNIGDAFLLVWKLFDKKQRDMKSLETFEKIKRNPVNQLLAELSLLSFIDIIIKINTKHEMIKYRSNKKILKKFPGFKIKMGFGLHVGWAIEGAIGSVFKIDASYLSPNVNMASRLEAATKQFDQLILFTGDLYDMFCTKEILQIIRHIDTVTVKGSANPVKLYTVDLNINNLIIEKKNGIKLKENFEKIKFNNSNTTSQFLSKNPKSFEISRIGNISLFKNTKKFKSSENEEIIERKINENNFVNIFDLKNENYKNFKIIFNFALESYLKGDWKLSKNFFERSFKIIKNDGPSFVIYEFLKSFNFVAPDNWKGYRELIEK